MVMWQTLSADKVSKIVLEFAQEDIDNICKIGFAVFFHKVFIG